MMFAKGVTGDRAGDGASAAIISFTHCAHGCGAPAAEQTIRSASHHMRCLELTEPKPYGLKRTAETARQRLADRNAGIAERPRSSNAVSSSCGCSNTRLGDYAQQLGHLL
jgi:hypothetical protein